MKGKKKRGRGKKSTEIKSYLMACHLNGFQRTNRKFGKDKALKGMQSFYIKLQIAIQKNFGIV